MKKRKLFRTLCRIKLVFMVVRSSILFIATLLAISCTSKQQEEKHRVFMIMFDISLSTRQDDMLNIYIGNYKQIQQSFKEGDVLIAGLITEKSISELSFPVNYAFPVYKPTTDNTLYQNAEKRGFELFQAHVRDSLIGIIDTLLHSNRKVLHTDIFSSLQLAEKVFNSFREYSKVLVIMSDMIESTPSCDFDRETLTESKITSIIEKNQAANLIPDLSDVKVYILGANYSNVQKYNEIQNFWLKYFEMCKANLTRENYNSALISFKE